MGVSVDNVRGLTLALSSSIFIGTSFIVKKKGLKKAGATGVRAGSGGFSYLYEPLWWVGMATMIIGEAANFAAYAFAPAILVTPLGALSIIVSAVLAHFMLKEKLHVFGVLGCNLCVVGSTTIVLHAPKERDIESVKEVWYLATEPGFLVYTCLVVVLVAVLIARLVPRYGQTHMIVYVGICSLMGSLTVMSVKALSIALRLTIQGMNQFVYYQTWFFLTVVIICILTQMNYLNKALDSFCTAVVSPVYYVMFTTFTILASMIMFKDWDSQNATQIATELCGFITILSGTFLLHKTEGMGNTNPTDNETNIFDKNLDHKMANYYDIDDILLEEEPISVVFQVEANGVGLLDPGSEANRVEKGAKIDIPFWLAHELYLRQAVSITVPPCFSLKTRKEIQADAACVDLKFRSPYFYELGRKLVPLVPDKTIGSFLLYAFTNRYKEILGKSHSTIGTTPKFTSKLTHEESQLFEAARTSMVAFKKWRVGGSRLEKASILGRKRKPNTATKPASP
ncbi:hypothetical protein HPP92_000355 [Vanilla planifolia]|uniref:Probable magnesium transporter n=1 Tax=Vanilla planifolia TaxID=51239 RepID=A0A835RPT0_VANPL|nr:hypothetical protein HPP92_000355 [Vanilla planifolia]